jgi:putative flippase GtrA
VKFLAYAFVGGICALLNVAAQWLCTSVIGLHYLASTLIAFFTITPLGFWLQKLLTFRTPSAAVRFEWPRYFATMGASLATNLALMYVLVSLAGVWYLFATLIVTVALLAANFLANDRWSFAPRR